MMAGTVLPTVRLIFPCDDARLDPQTRKWEIRHPWSAVFLPPGARFPFRLIELKVYAQLTDGIGSFNLSVEMLQVRDDGSRRSIGSSAATAMTFPSNQRFLAFDGAFHMKRVPFREAGLYEFRMIAETGEDVYQPLPGQTALLRVLDPRATP
jgi:hypothetical protein